MASPRYPAALRRYLPEPAARALRAVRRRIGASPMCRLCRQLRERGVALERLETLELFGDDGSRHTMDYAPLVRSLEIWEIKPERETALRQKFPSATIKIVDSFDEVKRTPNRYDLVVVDNWVGSLYAGHCEHFELFPAVFRLLRDEGILVINVVPRLDQEMRAGVPTVSRETRGEHLKRRSHFYGTEHPEAIAIPEMVEVYRTRAAESGFDLEWHVVQRRTFHYYLALKLRRR